MSKKSSIFAFIGLAYGLAWIIWFGLWLCGIKLGEPVSQISSIVRSDSNPRLNCLLKTR